MKLPSVTALTVLTVCIKVKVAKSQVSLKQASIDFLKNLLYFYQRK